MSDSGDILIRGMKMPVTCCHCPLIGYDPDIEWNDGGRETQGAYICVITHELIDNTKREDHCPLSPSADVRPVVRGKWIDHQEGRWIYAKCSECGTVHDVKSNFCPNCGADMREES